MRGRKNWRSRYSSIPFHENKWVWFHCCSYGEFQDGKSVMEAFRMNYPDYKILLTFSSPSGYEMLKNYKGADKVLYLPLDTASNAAFFVNCVKPAFVFFVRNDIWPNYVRALCKKGIPMFLISFTLTAKSKFFKFPQQSFYRNTFQSFSTIFVQDERSKNILEQYNFSNHIFVSGNCRIDCIQKIQEEHFEIPSIEKFVAGQFTVIAGSTLEKDRQLFLAVFSELKNENIKWIIVPHEIHKTEIAEAKKMFGNELLLFSEMDRLTSAHKLLWVDHVGLLAKMYKYAQVAFIGGGFNSIGIHNILEPAASSCAVCFGPNHRDLPEAIDLLANGAKVIHTEKELKDLILHYKKNPGNLSSIQISNMNYVRENSGATEKTFEQLEKYIPN